LWPPVRRNCWQGFHTLSRYESNRSMFRLLCEATQSYYAQLISYMRPSLANSSRVLPRTSIIGAVYHGAARYLRHHRQLRPCCPVPTPAPRRVQDCRTPKSNDFSTATDKETTTTTRADEYCAS